jgi:hypothetical protein
MLPYVFMNVGLSQYGATKYMIILGAILKHSLQMK